jgi:hypothetical protein
MNECTHGRIVYPNAQYPIVCERGRDCLDFMDEQQLERVSNG